MADALRRILWLFPVLGAGAVVLFFVLGTTSTVEENLKHPLFYNPAPSSAQVAAERALSKVLAGNSAGARELDVVGGAALPVVLDRMTTMSVGDQRKVAGALRPIAQRIQSRQRSSFERLGAIGQEKNSRSEALDRELLFWQRYRDEHALDLRPLSTSRLVRRMSERDVGRMSADLVAIDTYALPTLVAALGRVSTRSDVARTRRIVKMISTLTSEAWSVKAGASVNEARAVATEIRRFWDREGGRWTQMDRLELLVARASQTEFSAWIFRSARQVTGLDSSHLFERFNDKGRSTLVLAVSCLLGLLLFGPTIAAALEVMQLRQSRFQFERLGFRTAFSALLVLCVTWLVAREGTGWVRLALISALAGTTFSAFILHRELSDRVDWRTHHVLRHRSRLARVAAVGRWIAPSIPTLTPIAVAESALWVTCLEAGSRSEGLGLETLRALRLGDIDFLMAICLGLGLLTGTAQVLADMFLGNVRSRLGER